MKKSWFVGLCLSLLLFGCSAGEQGTPKQTSSNETVNERVGAPSLKLYTFDCGNIEVSDYDIFSSSGDYAGEGGKLVNTCYLVRHPEGDLLWDLGLPHAISDHFSAAELHLFAVSRQVALYLDNQFGIREPQLIARCWSEHSSVLAAFDLCGH